MKLLLKDIWSFLTNRLFLAFCLFTFLFYLVTVRLFDLQIVRGEHYLNNLNDSSLQPSDIEATRGTIYDRFGRPLAENETSYTIKIDPSITMDDPNATLTKLIDVLDRNNEEIIDTFPISLEEPYTFSFTTKTREERWKKDMRLDFDLTAQEILDLTAQKSFDKLKENFGFPKDISNEEARKLLNLRGAVYMERYRFDPITVAINVSKETIAAIEENNDEFQSVYIEVDSLRRYPEGKYMSHILGYIRGISAEEHALYKDFGYKSTDIIGKEGIEKAFELELKGTNGEMLVEVQNIGRRATKTVYKEPIPGDKVYLTLDAELQRTTYDYLEEMLSTIIINKMNASLASDKPLTVKDVLTAVIKSNNIQLTKLSGDEISVSMKIRTALLVRYPDSNAFAAATQDELKQELLELIETGEITLRDIVLIMAEQGLISSDEALISRIQNGNVNTLRQILVDKIKAKELTPQILNLDPSSGSVVVVDVHDGSVLTAVSYPSYDNNEFVNIFNNEYYTKLLNDPTFPLIHRAFADEKPPGSTFKMITTLAGLKAGVITPTTLIRDENAFQKAGLPYAHCWIGGSSGRSHGMVNVVKALEVSCNYFFYETSYRLGNAKEGTTYEGIKILNDYMRDFGLDSPAGVEIYEIYDSPLNVSTRISSPEYMQYLYDVRYGQKDVAWTDGETIRTAIGQSFNAYTPATMAKYIATLASGGVRYKLHLLDKIEDFDGALLSEVKPEVEKYLDIPQEDLDVVYQGMLAVTTGSSGTARRVFTDSEINVAGKTGTAQERETRNNHVTFAGFAPIEDPQIAVYVVIPYGDTTTTSSPAAQIAKKVIDKYFAIYSKPENNYMNNSLSE